MTIVLLGASLLAAAIGVWILVALLGYGVRDLLAFGSMSSVAFYLSRFDQMVWTEIWGRPYPGIIWFLVGLAAVLASVRFFAPLRPPVGSLQAALFGVGFAYLAILSGLIRGGWSGFASAVQVLAIILSPMAVAVLTIDIVPRTLESAARFRTSFIVLGGIATPIFLISTSVFAPMLSRYFGWGDPTIGRDTGFIRGWSPLGGSISTGFVLVLTYGWVLHEIIGRNRKRYTALLILIAVAMLFTLSRSAALMMMLFHVVYFWRIIRRHPARLITVALIFLSLFVALFAGLEDRFSFARFLVTQDSSTEVRASSAVAALAAGMEHPLLGHGPGMLYESIRTDWLDRRSPGMTDAPDHERFFVLENRVSAQEPHNLYLYLFAEHGVLAAILFCGWIYWLWQSSRIGPLLRPDGESISLTATMNALWVATLAMFLTASFPMVNLQTSVFFWTFAFYGLHMQALSRYSHRASEEVDVPTETPPHGRGSIGAAHAHPR